MEIDTKSDAGSWQEEINRMAGWKSNECPYCRVLRKRLADSKEFESIALKNNDRLKERYLEMAEEKSREIARQLQEANLQLEADLYSALAELRRCKRELGERMDSLMRRYGVDY